MCSTLVRKEERRLRSFCLGDPSARRLVGSLELAVPELGVLVGDLAHEGRLGPLGTAQLGVGGAKGQGGDESGDFHFAKMNKT